MRSKSWNLSVTEIGKSFIDYQSLERHLILPFSIDISSFHQRATCSPSNQLRLKDGMNIGQLNDFDIDTRANGLPELHCVSSTIGNHNMGMLAMRG